MRDYVNSTALQEYTTKLVAKLKTLFPGTPTAAATVADMTDHSKTYVYVGSETGYTAGDWYYWNGTAWTSGGPFQATSIITDTTLAVAGEAADAKATGDAIAAAKTAVLNAMAPAYSTSATYAVGAYVNYNGGIYRCTTEITTAESWTSGHWTAVVLGADLASQVSDLKTQFDLLQTKGTADNWEKGNFDTQTGANNSIDSYIRNQNFYGIFNGTTRIEVSDGYLMLLFAWKLDGTFVGSYKTTGIFDKTLSNYGMISTFYCAEFPNYKIKISFRRDPTSSEIDPSEGQNCSLYFYTDKTLSNEGKPADAKAVGDEVNELKTQLRTSDTSVYPKWEKGIFNSETGEYYSADTRIRADYICGLSTGVEKIYSENGFSMLLFAWDTNGNFIGSYKSSDTFTTGTSGYKYVTEFDCNLFPNYVVKVSVKDATGSTSIMAADGTNIHFQYNDETLTKKYKSADAKVVGDIITTTINATKVIADESSLKTPCYINYYTGEEEESVTWISTDYIDISAYNKLYVKMSNLSTGAYAGLAFYDEYKNFINNSGVQCYIDPNFDSAHPSMTVFNVNVPDSAKYIRASCRITNKNGFYIRIEPEIDTIPATPVLYMEKNPVTPAAGYANRVEIDKFIDAEDVSICARVNVTNSTILFMGSIDTLGGQHASHVQYDFSEKKIRIYVKGNGQSIPATVLHTVDFSGLGDIEYAQIWIGRRNRQLWVKVQNYVKTGNNTFIEYAVDESELNDYKYPAGWLADILTYGIISGTATFMRITAVTKANPFIAFIGDSITEGFGIPYESSWAYQVGQTFDSYLCMGRSAGTIVTAQRQADDIISKIKPKYTVVCIGTNGGNTEQLLKTLCESIRKYGSFPILCRIPMLENAITTSERNLIISSLLENTVGMDYATKNENDTQNTTLFQTDRIHPNVSGATAMANRFWEDMEWIKLGQ